MRLLAGVMGYMMMTGCGLILDLDPRDLEFDASADADSVNMDGGVGGDAHVRDANVVMDAVVFLDAFLPEDSGFDAGQDSGLDGAPDGALDDASDGAPDASEDAGPPRILVFRHERPDRPDTDVRSVWISEDRAPWRRIACRGGIREGFGTWECTHDVQPLPVGQHLRFYFDYGVGGVSPSCGSVACLGAHILIFDGVRVLDGDITEENANDTPASPGSDIRVKAHLTPP